MKSFLFGWVCRKFEVIREISSRNEKEAKLRNMLANAPSSKEVIKYAMYPFWNYGVIVNERAYPYSLEVSKRDNAKWNVFRAVLDELRLGNITGDKARKAVEKVLKSSSKSAAHWMMCIINKDLKIGVSHKTIKKIIPGLLPETDPMLCKVYEPTKHDVGNWYVEPKLDGFRALAIIENRKVTWVSRSGKPMWNTEVVEKQLLSLGVDNAVFDGELYAGDWSKTGQCLRKQSYSPLREKLVYTVFDIMPLKQWQEKRSSALEVRRNTLDKVFDRHRPGRKSKVNLRNVKPIDYYVIYPGSDAKAMIKAYANNGYEGVVFKDPKSKYEWKKSSSWLKGKPIYEGDFKVVGAKEGSGRFIGTLGSALVSGQVEYKGKIYKIKSKVAGFTDKQRNKYWKLHKQGKLNGRIFEVEFGEITKNKDTNDYSLRFPEFVRERGDKC